MANGLSDGIDEVLLVAASVFGASVAGDADEVPNVLENR